MLKVRVNLLFPAFYDIYVFDEDATVTAAGGRGGGDLPREVPIEASRARSAFTLGFFPNRRIFDGGEDMGDKEVFDGVGFLVDVERASVSSETA